MRLEVLWRQLAGVGVEHLVLDLANGVHADGLAVGELDGSAYRMHYQIDCSAAWVVRRMHIDNLLSGQHADLSRSDDGHWQDVASGVGLDSLYGCTDVDIMVTPFTNTLPIRRLGLKAGRSAEIAVVYVAVPGLVISKAEQRYTCLSLTESGGLYRYEGPGTDFVADVTVDTDGLVVNYPNIFKMDAKRTL